MKTRLCQLVVVCVALMFGWSALQLRADAKLTSHYFGCVDHGCKTSNDCTKLMCDVCAGDNHCALVP